LVLPFERCEVEDEVFEADEDCEDGEDFEEGLLDEEDCRV
jgi:hypothetical protein